MYKSYPSSAHQIFIIKQKRCVFYFTGHEKKLCGLNFLCDYGLSLLTLPRVITILIVFIIAARELGLDVDLRVTSAHKATEETLRIMQQYEDTHGALVFIAVAGRSNGLGPVLSGNTSYPVINCPPPSDKLVQVSIFICWNSMCDGDVTFVKFAK